MMLDRAPVFINYLLKIREFEAFLDTGGFHSQYECTSGEFAIRANKDDHSHKSHKPNIRILVGWPTCFLEKVKEASFQT